MPIFMPNGDQVKFESLDGKTGYYSTDNELYINGFTRMIAEHRGGLSEISEADYGEFSKKKQNSRLWSEHSWREEVTPGGPLTDTTLSRAAVAPEGSRPGAVAAVDTGKPTTGPTPSLSKPRIGKRPLPE